MLKHVRRLTPRPLRRGYHRVLNFTAAWRYGRPSRHMIVIGVTGTDGKTTTATMLAHLFSSAGWRTGLSSSVYQQIGEQRQMNESHMTMPGRLALHELLRRMVTAGCRVAIIEVSSEGISQYRHGGIDFDAAVITNISPEHLQAHGSFEKYRAAKGRLFGQIIKGGDKHLQGRPTPKISVVNLDDPQAEFFLKFWAEQHHGVTLESSSQLLAKPETKLKVWRAEQVAVTPSGSSFTVNGQNVQLPLPGRVNVLNALEAMAVASAYGLSMEQIRNGLATLPKIPGRFEDVPNNRGLRVVVDYALTPVALAQLYETLRPAEGHRLIAVFGAAGGGRDHWKRPELGRIAAQHCQVIILTTDDPYDEDPGTIAASIAQGIPASATAEVATILDRRAAIAEALARAKPGDVVAITGMGAETSMVVKDKKIPWNDATVAKEELARG